MADRKKNSDYSAQHRHGDLLTLFIQYCDWKKKGNQIFLGIGEAQILQDQPALKVYGN